jgi:hypothetical protein
MHPYHQSEAIGRAFESKQQLSCLLQILEISWWKGQSIKPTEQIVLIVQPHSGVSQCRPDCQRKHIPQEDPAPLVLRGDLDDQQAQTEQVCQ